MTTAGYVLVGGRSSRFGTDKARYEIDGQPLTLLTAEKVRRAAGAVALVGAPERYADFGLRSIPDAVAGFGPLAGIVSALEDTAAERSLIVAVDLPGVTVELMRFLLDLEGDVVLPMQADGRPQPLCAVYGRSALPRLRAAMEAGRGKVMAALEGLDVRRMTPEEYAHLGGAELFVNLNRLADVNWTSE